MWAYVDQEGVQVMQERVQNKLYLPKILTRTRDKDR